MNKVLSNTKFDLQKGKRFLASGTLSLGRYLFLALIGYVVLYPLLYMISNSVKSQAAFLDVSRLWIPAAPTLDKFKEVWEMIDFGSALLKTFTVQITNTKVVHCIRTTQV